MRLLFRDDLTCTREERQGVVVYHVEDPNTGALFRLYEIEYLITGKLDGTRDDDEVIAEVKRDYGFTMSEQDFEQFVNQLTERGFLRRVEPELAFEVGDSEVDDQDNSTGDFGDGAATRVFVAPVDNTATQRFEISETARLIEAGDTSHLAPPKPVDKLKLASYGLAGLGAILVCIWGIAMLMVSPIEVVIASSQPKKVAVFYDGPGGRDEGALSVRPQREAWLSFGASGKVKELNAAHGDSVKQGDVIAALAIPASMQRQLDRARAKLVQKDKVHQEVLTQLDGLYSERAAIEAKRLEVDRELKTKRSEETGERASRKQRNKWTKQRADYNKKLSGLVRKERKLRERELKLQLAVAKAKTALEARELKLYTKIIRAPFDGIIAESQLTREGQAVERDKDVMRLMDPSSLEVIFQVKDLGGERIGADVFVSAEGREPISGTIRQVNKGLGGEGSDVSVVIPDGDGSLSLLAPSDFFLVKDFRDPAFETVRSSLKEVDGEAPRVPIVRDGAILWVPVRVLRKTPKTAVLEPVGDFTISDTDSFVVAVPGRTFKDLATGERAAAVIE